MFSRIVLLGLGLYFMSVVTTPAIMITGDNRIYAQNERVWATFTSASTVYTDRVYLSGNPLYMLFDSYENHVGDTLLLGTYSDQTELLLELQVANSWMKYSNDATLNGDGMDHVRFTVIGSTLQIGWEDMWYGGDQDYNDLVITLRACNGVQLMVPEPGVWIMVALGLAGMALIVLRRKTQGLETSGWRS